MRQKGKTDIIQLRFFAENSLHAFFLLFRHPQVFLPDLLIVLVTLLLASAFLAFNNLLTPLFLDQARLLLFRDQLLFILNSAPHLLQFILSFLLVLFVNVLFGISLLALRYEYLKELASHQPTTLLRAYHRSRNYLISLIAIKLVLSIIYFAFLFIFGYLFTTAPPWLNYAIVPVVLLLLVFRIAFFFIIQNLYVEDSGMHAFPNAIRYFRTFPKQTLLTLLLVTGAEFLIALLLGFFPTTWAKVALRTDMLQATTLVIIIFLTVRTLLNILVTLWGETFKFLIYTKNN